MGMMKDFDIRIRNGGDDAIAAVSEYVAEQERLISQVESMLQRACDRQWREWISVSDMLPKEGESVIAAVRDRARELYWNGRQWVYPASGEREDGGVTHWMPLPAPPTDAK